jgi:hypothetical protein
MGQAFILSVVYVLILIVIMAAYFLVNGPEIPRWFWPTAAGSDFSIRLAAVAVAAMVLSIMTLDGDALTRVVTIIPVLFFAVLYFAYRRPASETIGAPLPWSVGLLRKNTLASVANWLVIAVLPACGFIKVAADAENAILVRYENEYLAQQLAGRTCAIEDRYQDVDLSGICTNGECGYPAQRLTTSLDLYPSSMFLPDRAHWGDSARDALSARLAPFDDALPDATAEAGGATPEQAEAQYFERVSKRIWVRAAKGEPLGGEPRAQEPEPNYWSSLAWLKPIYGGTVVGTRYLDTPAIAEERARAGEWSWMPIDDQFVFGASSLACGTGLVIASGVPLHVDAVLGDWRVGIPAVILLAAVVLWTRYGVRRIFFGEIEDPVTHDLAQLEKIMAGTAPDQKLWLVAGVTSPAHRARLLTRRAADAESGGNFTRLDADSFGQGSRRRAALLQALRTAEYERRNVLLVTRGNLHQLVAPEDETTVADGDTTDALTPATADEWRSWRRLLSDARFLIVASVKPSGLQQSTSFWRRRLDRPASVGWLAAELGPLPEPETVKQQLLPALLGSTRRQALDRICDYASSFYFGLWDSCSEADKLVLVQLTFENVVNPKQSGVVRQLLERGLLARDPALRLFNRSFALFITRIHDPSETLKWEQHTAGFSWAQTRWVLVGFLLLGLLFLWTTQRELFNTGLMFVSAAAVGLPSALKLMTSLNKSSKEL